MQRGTIEGDTNLVLQAVSLQDTIAQHRQVAESYKFSAENWKISAERWHKIADERAAEICRLTRLVDVLSNVAVLAGENKRLKKLVSQLHHIELIEAERPD